MSELRISKNTKKPEASKSIPDGAKELSRDTSVDVEAIENGFLITKRTEVRYQVKGKDYSDYFYETKKYYSETDPLTITTEDKALADAFEEE